ncbi:DUF5658 family protein [Natrialba sp. SSL1]|uniref:DUF5658 family protein n=1 Tax=Natrialba sp. SSL1 TaxID=1869245 RepID=UPI0008F87F69|nr:DUF5658 family protein [Natrialba sp. SSL1]OIB55778.1 hypothetical protein BBD46_02920 [Natrialba sp. SSL1]
MATRQVTPERNVPTISVRTLEYACWLLVALTFVGDITTTHVGLQLGLAESNPVGRAAIESAGIFGMVALKVFAVAVALACRPLLPASYRPIIPAGLTLPWLLAVGINTCMILTAA